MRQPDEKFFIQRPKAKGRVLSCIVVLIVLALSACTGSTDTGNVANFSFKDPSGEPVKAILRTTVPLGYAASVAMSSVTGTTLSDVSSSNTCSSYPCSAVVTITDNNSAPPLELASYGTITVYGRWTSSDKAILTVSFGSHAGSTLFPVHNVSLFPVSRTGSKLTIVYASIDINATFKDPGTAEPAELSAAIVKLDITPSSEARQNIGMEAWVIEVDDKDTPAVSDDTYSVSGGGQYLELSPASESVLQLALSNVVMEPGCALNPGSGSAVFNEVGISSADLVVATAILSFHPSCDGKAKVVAGSGNYLLSMGHSIPLRLTSP